MQTIMQLNSLQQAIIGFVVIAASLAYVLLSEGGMWDRKDVVSPAPSVSVPMAATPTPLPPPPPREKRTYIQVIQGCGPAYGGACVNARSGPGTDHQVVMKLRSGMVFATAGVVRGGGRSWYRISFDEWLRYPDRARAMYVAADLVTPVLDEGPLDLADAPQATTSKRIIVDRSSQMLYAYEGETLFMKQPVSTGIKLTPTPRGSFTVYRKTPTRYMQGPIPGISTKQYDLPGVPWNLYFTEEGAVIHGAYWHNSFGKPYSNGCVNLPFEKAKQLYQWAAVGTAVYVRD